VIRSDAREHAAMTTGFLHPGAMGSSLAQTCSGRRIWVSTDRSPETRARAERAGIDDVGSLESLVAEADTIVSICPPDQAPAVARSVAEHGFDGVYVDANAISPATARAVGASFGRFVDGGVIGPPVDRAGTTRLYLSGAEASRVAARWEHSALDVRIIDGGPGAASALKMCYAAWTKGTAALLLAVNALSEIEEVADALASEWAISQPGLSDRSHATAAGVAPKAWRFTGEMEEIAATFAAAGLPTGFHEGAAETYERLSAFRTEPADLAAVIAALSRG
jgi:3-hydroxyisobutyrate dehydrogenase-like beta-hydroxyacid dehydrogenase